MFFRILFHPKVFVFSAIFVFSLMYGYVITNKDVISSHQAWGVFHYYINAKYFDEVGYDKLYQCTALALDGNTDFMHANRFVRDLITYELEPFAHSASKCDKKTFTPERWDAFQYDIQHIIGFNQSTYWLGVLKDKGFNASPFWLMFGTPLANLAPIDGVFAIMVLHIDWIILALSCILVAIYFSPRIGAVFTLFLLFFFGTHTRLVGNYFQFIWLGCAVLGIVAWQAKRFRLSGVLFGISTVLRVFPAVFVIGLLIQTLIRFNTKVRDIDQENRIHFVTWFFASIVALVGVSSVADWRIWGNFIEKILHHANYIINEPFHMGFASFSRSFLVSGAGGWISMILGISAVTLYLYCIVRSDILEGFGLSAILMYFLLTSSPYYVIGVGLLILSVAQSKKIIKYSVLLLFALWLICVLVITPHAFFNLRAIAYVSTEIITLCFYLGVLVIFAFSKSGILSRSKPVYPNVPDVQSA